jgi:hypothetical protein
MQRWTSGSTRYRDWHDMRAVGPRYRAGRRARGPAASQCSHTDYAGFRPLARHVCSARSGGVHIRRPVLGCVGGTADVGRHQRPRAGLLQNSAAELPAAAEAAPPANYSLEADRIPEPASSQGVSKSTMADLAHWSVWSVISSASIDIQESAAVAPMKPPNEEVLTSRPVSNAVGNVRNNMPESLEML